MFDFIQKSVLKWIELLGLDRIGLNFYTEKIIKVNRNVGYKFLIACLIAFDLIFVKESYLIEIHRNSDEKLI